MSIILAYLPLSADLIEMYKVLKQNDKAEITELYMAEFNRKEKSLKNLIYMSDKCQPSGKERSFLTKHILRLYKTATIEGYLRDKIEAEVDAELGLEKEKNPEEILRQRWKNGELGKNAKAMQSY